jgi:hypothetical protein
VAPNVRHQTDARGCLLAILQIDPDEHHLQHDEHHCGADDDHRGADDHDLVEHDEYDRGAHYHHQQHHDDHDRVAVGSVPRVAPTRETVGPATPSRGRPSAPGQAARLARPSRRAPPATGERRVRRRHSAVTH